MDGLKVYLRYFGHSKFTGVKPISTSQGLSMVNQRSKVLTVRGPVTVELKPVKVY